MATWQKAFRRIFWKNRPDTTTPLGESNLLPMDASIDEMDDRIITLNQIKAEQSDLLLSVKDVSFNSANGKIIITKWNGTTIEFDTDIEKIAINFAYDSDPTSAHYQCLVLTLSDGSVQYIDLSALITQYEFTDTATIHFEIDNTGKVKANIINGSITIDHLSPALVAAINGSGTHAQDSEAWAVGTKDGTPVASTDPQYNNHSKYWAQQAQAAAQSIPSMANIMLAIYPVGSIYMSVVNTDPGTLFGGTWAAWGSGKVPVGVDTSDNDFKTVEKTGGAKTVTLTAAQSGVPAHSHGLNSHKHSVGAHSHGLNSHTHSVGAHSHGLNSHTHSVGAHSHGLNGHTHAIGHNHYMQHNHLIKLRYFVSYGALVGGDSVGIRLGDLNKSSHSFIFNNASRIGDSTNKNSALAGSTNSGGEMYESEGSTGWSSDNYTSNVIGGTQTDTQSGGASGSTANSDAFNTGAASGSTANSSAFNTGAASGSTANSTAFDTGAASGSTANNTAANASSAHTNLQPYITCYMWKRTA